MRVRSSGVMAMPLGKARSPATARDVPSGDTTATIPGAGSSPAMRSNPAPLTYALPRPSTTISLRAAAGRGPRSARVASDPAASWRSRSESGPAVTSKRSSASQSIENGSLVGTRAITSGRPSPPTARTSCAPQSHSHRRPSCQRGDSPNASPSTRTSGLGIPQRARRREVLAGLQPCLQPREDHRPAAVELVVGALAQLVVDDGQPARVADRLDLPRHPRRALGLDVLAPARVVALDEPPRRVDLEGLAVDDRRRARRVAGHVARAGRPLRLDPDAEVVVPALLGIDDRLPQPIGRRLDVDLEDLVHRSVLQSLLEPAQRGRPGLGVLAHPPVVDDPDRDGVEEVELLPPAPPGDHQPGLLEHLEVLHDAEARHGHARLERVQCLPVLTEELVEQTAPRGVAQGPEHVVHGRTRYVTKRSHVNPDDVARPLFGEAHEMGAPCQVDLAARTAEGLAQADLRSLWMQADREAGGGLDALIPGQEVDHRAAEQGRVAERGREGGAPALAQAAGNRRLGVRRLAAEELSGALRDPSVAQQRARAAGREG